MNLVIRGISVVWPVYAGVSGFRMKITLNPKP